MGLAPILVEQIFEIIRTRSTRRAPPSCWWSRTPRRHWASPTGAMCWRPVGSSPPAQGGRLLASRRSRRRTWAAELRQKSTHCRTAARFLSPRSISPLHGGGIYVISNICNLRWEDRKMEISWEKQNAAGLCGAPLLSGGSAAERHCPGDGDLRPMVSRLLSEARALGVVEITVHDPESPGQVPVGMQLAQDALHPGRRPGGGRIGR